MDVIMPEAPQGFYLLAFKILHSGERGIVGGCCDFAEGLAGDFL